MKVSLYRFNSETDTGINVLPTGSIISVESVSSIPNVLFLKDTTGLIDTSTIVDAYNNGNVEGISGGASGGLEIVYATSDVTASSGQLIIADGAITVTLPGSPNDGDQVVVQGVEDSQDNGVTIDPNGNTINGTSDVLIGDVNNFLLNLVFYNGDWKVGGNG